MAMKKTLGILATLAFLTIGGCKNTPVENIDFIEKHGKTNDAEIFYGHLFRRDHKDPKNKKMVVNYNNGVTLILYDKDKDGIVDYIGAKFKGGRHEAQILYDSLKAELDTIGDQ